MIDAMNTDVARISAEYERRNRAIPADFYSWSKPANLLQDQSIVRGMIRLLHRGGMFPLDGKRVADIGCGVGTWLLEFIQWGADPDMVAGIDLMPDRLERARRRLPLADLHLGNAAELPWASGSFDLLSQILVFTNMFDPNLKRAVAQEMLRVLKPGGAVLWLDLRVNNPRNPQVRGLKKHEVRELFPDCAVTLEPVLLAPPLARLVTPKAWVAAELLNAFPLLRTHYVGLIRKPAVTR